MRLEKMKHDALNEKILFLEQENEECKAAIKDAAYCAENSIWKSLWLKRYSNLLPNVTVRGVPPTKAKRSRRTLIKNQTSKPPAGGTSL